MGEEAEEAALGPEGQHMGGLLGSPSPHTSQLATEAAAPWEWRTAAVRPLSPARGLRQGGRASQETTPLLAEAQWGAWAPPSGLSWALSPPHWRLEPGGWGLGAGGWGPQAGG